MRRSNGVLRPIAPISAVSAPTSRQVLRKSARKECLLIAAQPTAIRSATTNADRDLLDEADQLADDPHALSLESSRRRLDGRRRRRLVLVAHVDVGRVAHRRGERARARRRCTAARAGGGSGTARRSGSFTRTTPSTPLQRLVAEVPRELHLVRRRALDEGERPAVVRPFVDDAHRPEPVAEREHALEEGRHAVEPRQRELDRELEAVGDRVRPLAELVGARQPVARSS